MAALLLLTGVSAVAQGQVPGGGLTVGANGRSLTQLKGQVMCAGCSLEEVRKAQPSEHHLYQFSYSNGQIVMKVTEVNKSSMFEAVAWPPRLWLRANDKLLQQLSAEENLFKEMELTGLLTNSRTFDLFSITVS